MEYSPTSSWDGNSHHAFVQSQSNPDQPSHESPPKTPSTDAPLRQDSAYYSTKDFREDSSEIDIEIQAKQLRARERVEIRRARVLRTRYVIQGRRQNVRHLREKAREASAQLARKLNEAMALGSTVDLHGLVPYHERMQAALDELGPTEDEYDSLERRLTTEEEDLEEEEDYFYRHNKIELPVISDSKLDEVLSPLIKPYQPPEEDEYPDFDLMNGQVREYLGKVSAAEKLQKELEQLENRHNRIVEEWKFRKTHDVPLSQEEKDFLALFPELYRVAHDRLITIERDLFDLRDECLEQHLFTDSEYAYEAHDSFSEDLLDLVYETRERSPLAAALQPPHNFESGEDDLTNKRKYVNKWLLEGVQDSLVETLQLRAWIYFEYHNMHKTLVDIEWPVLALHMWDKDSAGEGANESQSLSRMDAIYGGTGNPTEINTGVSNGQASFTANYGDAGLREEVIIGTEAESYSTEKVPSESTPKKLSRRRSV